jgi:hypothetical protein
MVCKSHVTVRDNLRSSLGDVRSPGDLDRLRGKFLFGFLGFHFAGIRAALSADTIGRLEQIRTVAVGTSQADLTKLPLMDRM